MNCKVLNGTKTRVTLGESSHTASHFNSGIRLGGSHSCVVTIGNNGQIGTHTEDRSGLGLYRRSNDTGRGCLADRFGR